MNRSRRAGLVLAVAVGALAQPRAARAQLPAAFLIAEARRQLDDLNADSAAILLRLALDSRARANRPESIRALVLLGVTEIMAARQDDARRAFREALALDPDLRVDSLADLHSQLLPIFTSVRSAMPATAEQLPPTPPAGRPMPQPTAQPAAQPVEEPPAARPAVGAAHREGSIELSVGAGVFSVDNRLSEYVDALNHVVPADFGRFALAGVGRVGYNFTQKLGVSLGSGFGGGNGKSLLSGFAALTYTPDLNKKMSPFVAVGAGLTRISGDNTGKTALGVHVGVGVRSMIGENLALRVESRMAYEPWSGTWGSQTAFNGTATLGLSYFMGGGPPRDTDADGVPDKRDLCPDTPPARLVTSDGCPTLVRVR